MREAMLKNGQIPIRLFDGGEIKKAEMFMSVCHFYLSPRKSFQTT